MKKIKKVSPEIEMAARMLGVKECPVGLQSLIVSVAEAAAAEGGALRSRQVIALLVLLWKISRETSARRISFQNAVLRGADEVMNVERAIKEFDHWKELPGEPSPQAVFQSAWSRIYRNKTKSGQGVAFSFNGYKVTIEKE